MKRIAVPVNQGVLSTHFGQADEFVIYSVDGDKIVSKDFAIPPEHQQGSHPFFLKETGCDVVLTGGMGIKAQSLLKEYGIEVIIGVDQLPVEEVVTQYLKGTLQSGFNRCDH